MQYTAKSPTCQEENYVFILSAGIPSFRRFLTLPRSSLVLMKQFPQADVEQEEPKELSQDAGIQTVGEAGGQGCW